MILFPVSREAYLSFLLCSLVVGILLGAFYEIFRIRRRLFPVGTWLSCLVIAVEDIIFFTVYTVAMILVCYKLSYGVPRWYAYASSVLGFMLWRKTVGRLVMSLSDGLKNAAMPVILRLKKIKGNIDGKINYKIAVSKTRRRQRRMLDGIFKDEK